MLISPPLSPTPTPEPTLDPVVPAPTPEPTPVPDPVTIPAPNPDPVSGPELPPDPNPITPASPPDIPGATPGIINLGLGLIRTSAKSVNELLVVATDDADGRINGIAPDEAGYSQALLDQAVVVFSTLKTSDSLSDLATSRSLRLPSDSNLQFAIIENGSLDGLRQGSSGKLQLVYEASGDRVPSPLAPCR
ncbi:MAG: hypothetical protein HC873_12065 [Leptolyngbyaceae cyanobacterium SL_1_1]|nr:hypothetical protein [Leptolyngbyaceae cyanobacterium SL_1_1]